MAKTDLQRHIDKLVKEHGGLRAAARWAKVDHAYLWRMQKGLDKGSDEAIEKIGLKRTEMLRPL